MKRHEHRKWTKWNLVGNGNIDDFGKSNLADTGGCINLDEHVSLGAKDLNIRHGLTRIG